MKNLFKSQLLVILFGLGILSSCGGDDPAPAFNSIPNEQARFLFDGNASDGLGGLVNATVNNATLTTDRKGNANSAYQFTGDADSNINLGGNAKLEADTAFSFSVWLKADKHAGTPVDKLGEYQLGTWIELDCSPAFEDCIVTNRAMTLRVARSDKSNQWRYQVGADAMRNQWDHYVMTFSNDNMYLYINGVERTNYKGTGGDKNVGDLTASNDDLILGAYFKGAMDDFRFYNRVLTEDEVKLLYSDK